MLTCTLVLPLITMTLPAQIYSSVYQVSILIYSQVLTSIFFIFFFGGGDFELKPGVLTRVQLTSGHEAGSNTPLDVGLANPGYNPCWGRSTEVKSRSGLNTG